MVKQFYYKKEQEEREEHNEKQQEEFYRLKGRFRTLFRWKKCMVHVCNKTPVNKLANYMYQNWSSSKWNRHNYIHFLSGSQKDWPKLIDLLITWWTNRWQTDHRRRFIGGARQCKLCPEIDQAPWFFWVTTAVYIHNKYSHWSRY